MDTTQREITDDLKLKCVFSYDHDAFWTLDELIKGQDAAVGGTEHELDSDDFGAEHDHTIATLVGYVIEDEEAYAELKAFCEEQRETNVKSALGGDGKSTGTVWVLITPDATGESTEVEIFSERPKTIGMGGDPGNWPLTYWVYAGNIDGGDSQVLETVDLVGQGRGLPKKRLLWKAGTDEVKDIT